jgi:protein MpaA
MRRGASICALAIGALLLVLALPVVVSAKDQQQRFGTSVRHRPLALMTRGAAPIGADGIVDVLVVGSVHGDERAGEAIVQRLRKVVVPRGQRWWLVTTVNPDGTRAHTRQNARGVDLNRNFPSNWHGGGRPWDVYYPGSRMSSEPETRAVEALIKRVHPELTIWYHQHANRVIRPATTHALSVATFYARASGMRVRPWQRLRGTAVGWQLRFDRTSAPLVVELPAGALSASAVRRHARAIARTAASPAM